LYLEYDPVPRFNAGSPAKVLRVAREFMTQMFGGMNARLPTRRHGGRRGAVDGRCCEQSPHSNKRLDHPRNGHAPATTMRPSANGY
jgi:hypothetical protein